MALFVENVNLALVFVNAFVMALVSLPMYVNFAHCTFFTFCSCFFLLHMIFEAKA
jgi:hypothetical protein